MVCWGLGFLYWTNVIRAQTSGAYLNVTSRTPGGQLYWRSRVQARRQAEEFSQQAWRSIAYNTNMQERGQNQRIDITYFDLESHSGAVASPQLGDRNEPDNMVERLERGEKEDEHLTITLTLALRQRG